MIFVRKRKGILLPETLKIVIASVCILLLVYLGWSMWNLFVTKSRFEQAKQNMIAMEGIMSSLGDKGSQKYVLTSPQGYVVVGWPFETAPGEPGSISILPNSCIEKGMKSCWCFCPFEEKTEYLGKDVVKAVDVFSIVKTYWRAANSDSVARVLAKNCDSEGICRAIPNGKNLSVTSIIFTQKDIEYAETHSGATKFYDDVDNLQKRAFTARVSELNSYGADLKIMASDREYSIIAEVK